MPSSWQKSDAVSGRVVLFCRLPTQKALAKLNQCKTLQQSVEGNFVEAVSIFNHRVCDSISKGKS